MKADSIYVFGKFPFLIMLEDSIDENRFPIDDKGINLETNDGIYARLFLKKKINKNEEGRPYFTEDFYGEITYSDFLITYEELEEGNNALNEMFFKNESWNIDVITLYTTNLVNIFICIYKVVNKHEKDWIPFVTKSRLSPWGILVLDNQGDRIGGIDIQDYRGTGASMGSILSAEQIEELKRTALMKNLTLHPAVKFAQEANRYKKTGDFVGAIIFLAFYLEKWIFREVTSRFEKNGMSNTEILSLLKKEDGRYIDKYKAVMLITLNDDFQKTDAFKAFKKYVTIPRDEIIHKDRVEIDEDLAENAMGATMAFRNLLMKEIWR